MIKLNNIRNCVFVDTEYRIYESTRCFVDNYDVRDRVLVELQMSVENKLPSFRNSVLRSNFDDVFSVFSTRVNW